MKKDMSSNAKLSFLERFGYGVGDYAANLVYSAISAFLLVYYTNVIGASAAAAASIIAVSKIFDGVSDGLYCGSYKHKVRKGLSLDRKALRAAGSVYGADVQRTFRICRESADCIHVSDLQSGIYYLLHWFKRTIRNASGAYDDQSV